jgi:CheY-like chemotaxis protein
MNKTIHILVVDDESGICDMLSRHFRFLGYKVATASNGVEALQYMSQHSIDILITDIMMPVMNGIELTAQTRKDYPFVRMLVVSGYVTLENALRCLRNGVDGIFAKPLEDLGALERAVTRSTEILQEWSEQLSLLNASKPSR